MVEGQGSFLGVGALFVGGGGKKIYRKKNAEGSHVSKRPRSEGTALVEKKNKS